VKTLHKKLLRWKGTFRGLSAADSLLLYAGSTPRTGSAVWHSHPRNHVPHVHVEAAKSDDEKGQQSHRHLDEDEHHDHDAHVGEGHSVHADHPRDHEHDDSHDAGHWHFVVPAERLRVSQELLAYSKSEIWLTLHDLADGALAFRPTSSARAPPDCVSPF
jgi:hypothetical protein